MKVRRIVAAFAIACWLSGAGEAVAKGAGGGHGSGGHSSGGHASGGHASGGRSSGGHASGSHAGTTSHGNAVPRASGAGQSSGSVHTAVQRPGVSTPFATSTPLRYLPSRIIWPAYSSVLGFSAFGLMSDPFWPTYGGGYGQPSYAYGYGSAWPYSEWGATFPFDDFDDAGSLRLQVEPRDAQVYVDGYYAGVVDDFDGHFQHLDLSPRPHRVEIRAPGYQPLVFDVVIQPHHKTDYRGRLLPSTP
jgi:hypothetical protein